MPTPTQLDLNDPAQVRYNNEIKSLALQRALAVAGLTALTGGVLRSLIGSNYLFGRPGSPYFKGNPDQMVSMPIPADFKEDEEDKDKSKDRRGRKKSAANGSNSFPPVRTLRDLHSDFFLSRWLTDRGGSVVSDGNDRRLVLDAPSMMRGDYATSASNLWWNLPALLLASVGGLAGGWWIADKLLDAKSKRDLELEVEEAKKQYEKSLQKRVELSKRGGEEDAATKLGMEIDALFDDMSYLACRGADESCNSHTKVADGWSFPGSSYLDGYADWGGKYMGLLATLALALAGTTAYLSYRASRQRSKRKLIEDAVEKRRREMEAARPPEIFVTPYTASG